MKYLVAISVGPVQSFIAAARRTRDLWYGSHLLSQVSKSLARQLHGRHAELIFPFATELDTQLLDDSSFTVVNKLLAIVDAENEDDLALQAGSWKAAAQKYLLDELRKAQLRIVRSAEVDFDLAAEQLAHFVEFSAAWKPFAEEGYRELRLDVEELISGRKALRDFEPHHGVAGLPKSSLDGARETVILSREAESHEIKKKEELDGIGVLKRFGAARKAPRFDSTHEAAGAPLLERLEKSNKRQLDALKHFLKMLHVPGCAEFLYRPAALEEYLPKLTPEQKRDFEELRAPLLVREPAPAYYAVLAGDGDGTGAHIRSKEKPGEHQEFSKCLSDFATEAERTIIGHNGDAVYTGGDDVLALLPLHRALAAAWRLRREFGGLRGSPTFSAGIAVVHAMDDLTHALALARKAERLAKDAGGDALGIIIAPRSGAELEVAGHWDELAVRLDEITDLYRQPAPGALSKGLAHELRSLLRSCPSELNFSLIDLALAIAGKKDQAKAAKGLVERCRKDSAGLALKAAEQRKQLTRLTSALLAARIFARAKTEADWQLGRELI